MRNKTLLIPQDDDDDDDDDNNNNNMVSYVYQIALRPILSRRTCPPTHLDLYNYAAKHFSQAKTMYEGLQTGEIPPAPGMPADLPELDHLLKIAKTNFVVMKLLLGGHKADVKARPEYDFSCHKIYPIIKV